MIANAKIHAVSMMIAIQSAMIEGLEFSTLSWLVQLVFVSLRVQMSTIGAPWHAWLETPVSSASLAERDRERD